MTVVERALEELREALGPKGYMECPEDMAPFLRPWRGSIQGHADLVILPATTSEVAECIGICAKAGLSVTTQGGNTGLVAGQIPAAGVLLSTKRMRAIRHISTADDVIVVEAGATLLEVQEAALQADRLFPLSLAAEGSATIGGIVSTNAGGTAVLRYGNARDLVLGVEVVCADGSVLHGLRTLRKDNSGYDLKQLFIGSEGTLGIVTAVSLKLFPVPQARATALLAVEDAQDAVALLERAKVIAAGQLDAFELISGLGIALAAEHVPSVRSPFSQPVAWAVLVEVAGMNEAHVADAMSILVEEAYEAGLVTDGVIAHSATQRSELWLLRETQSEAQKAEGLPLSFDVSLSINSLGAMLGSLSDAVRGICPGARAMPFGHLGDGNIHYNLILPRETSGGACEQITRIVHDLVMADNGSISAEHGLGRVRTAEAARFKSSAELKLHRILRQALDPHRLLNPDVLF